MTRADDGDDFAWFKPLVEVPFCGACGDNGCRMCQPTRLHMWRQTWRYRLRALTDWLHGRHNNQLPF